MLGLAHKTLMAHKGHLSQMQVVKPTFLKEYTFKLRPATDRLSQILCCCDKNTRDNNLKEEIFNSTLNLRILSAWVLGFIASGLVCGDAEHHGRLEQRLT